MELSRTERLILLNQFKILEASYEGEADTYRKYQKALRDGYVLEYDTVFGSESLGEELSKEVCQEVRTILEMYRAIELSYDQLPDKSGISDADFCFQGFDGNDRVEQSLMGYARYILHDLGEYFGKTTSMVDVNSHRPMLGRYRAMVRKWEDLGKKSDSTADGIRWILSAKPESLP